MSWRIQVQEAQPVRHVQRGRGPAALRRIVLGCAATAALALNAHGAWALTLNVSASATNAPADAAFAQSGATAPDASVHTLGLRAALALLREPKSKLASQGNLDRLDIVLGDGTYRLDQPLHITVDGSWRDTPVTISGTSEAHTIISGSRVITLFHAPDAATNDRLSAPARGHVLVAELSESGIHDLGTFERHGFAIPVKPAPLELFYRDAPATIARWPDSGFATIEALPDGETGRRFTVANAPLAALANEPDLRAFGFWSRDWADTTLEVESVDAGAKTLTLKAPAPMFGLKTGQRVYLENALALLDRPGEWYVDSRTQRLYFWPPAPLKDGEVEASVSQGAFVLDNAPGVTIRNLTIEQVRGNAIVINGADREIVENTTVRNTGGVAVWSTASDSHFRFMHVSNTGEGGFVIYAGNRGVLSPGNTSVEDSVIHDYSRRTHAYRPAIAVAGVADRIERNHIYDAPHNAIIFSGNDHRIAGNEIDHVAREVQDTGAIYTGQDWTARGTVIEGNFLHDIGSPDRPIATMGVYLDDQASGTTVRGNLFLKVNQAVFIGGGRDNVVENNLFVGCSPAVYVDSRGLQWQHGQATDPNGAYQHQLTLVHYTQPPYSTRYPSLTTVLSDEPGAPKGTIIRGNAVVGGKPTAIDSRAQPYVQVGKTFGASDITFARPMADDARATADDLRIAPTSSAIAQGFVPPAFSHAAQ